MSFRPQNKIYSLVCNFKLLIPLPPIKKTCSVYCIPCLRCNASYIDEKCRTAEIRLSKYKYSFEIGELKSKIVIHAIETDHRADFDHLKVLISNINKFNSRIFLKGKLKRQRHTSTQSAPITSACAIPLENAIFLSVVLVSGLEISGR